MKYQPMNVNDQAQEAVIQYLEKTNALIEIGMNELKQRNYKSYSQIAESVANRTGTLIVSLDACQPSIDVNYIPYVDGAESILVYSIKSLANMENGKLINYN